MKTTEFLKENSIIAQEADDMHKDHEVQMARSQMYSAAQSAIEIHRLLKNISELEGLDGWVASKLTLASEYLETVRDYLKYEAVSAEPEMMEFVREAADHAFDTLLDEGKADPVGSWVVHDGSKVKRFKSRDGAKAYAEKNGGKVASSEHYADKIQGKQDVKENASAGASSAGGVAVSMGGPGHKPTTGVPKKVGNAHKSKKVTVGKGIY
jgi:hypothetical protein